MKRKGEKRKKGALTEAILIICIFLFLIIGGILLIFFTPKNQEPSENITLNCSADTYNCNDFATFIEAQAVFDYCISQGAGDIHVLDYDGNGKACQSMP